MDINPANENYGSNVKKAVIKSDVTQKNKNDEIFL